MDKPLLLQMSAERQEAFHSRYRAGKPSECWEWQAARNRNGYGEFYAFDKSLRAHRLVAELAAGRLLAVDEFACHHCDNPPCVNPDHLYVGTASSNLRDALDRGRKIPRPARGEKSHLALLTEHDVLTIWAARLESTSALAKRFGVAVSTISAIWRGENWGHLTRGVPQPFGPSLHPAKLHSGEGNPAAKITREVADQIRSLEGSMKKKDIAARFGVSPATIYLIHKGRTWR